MNGIELIRHIGDRLSIREGELYCLRMRLAAWPDDGPPRGCCRRSLKGLIRGRRNRVRKLRRQLERAEGRGK